MPNLHSIILVSLFAEALNTQMGLLHAFVCRCFSENVIFTCKIVSFLCSLDNFLLQNVIVLIFGNQILKWRSFEISAILTYFSHFSHQGNNTKNPSVHISYHIHVFSLPYWLFASPVYNKKKRIYHVWFLLSMPPCVDSYLHHFEAINR